MDLLKIIIVSIGGYLLGSLNTSLLVGKLYGMDVRKYGSGNAGMTNTLRTIGKIPALLVTIGDVAKGIVACLLGSLFIDTIWNFQNVGFIVAGVAAVIGHNWPVFFGFKGGKGILTTLAVILMMEWKIGVILVFIFFLVVLVTKYVSLASIIAAILFPCISYLFREFYQVDMLFIICASILAVLAIWRHKTNIQRLWKGTENRITFSKSSKQKEAKV